MPSRARSRKASTSKDASLEASSPEKASFLVPAAKEAPESPVSAEGASLEAHPGANRPGRQRRRRRLRKASRLLPTEASRSLRRKAASEPQLKAEAAGSTTSQPRCRSCSLKAPSRLRSSDKAPTSKEVSPKDTSFLRAPSPTKACLPKTPLELPATCAEAVSLPQGTDHPNVCTPEKSSIVSSLKLGDVQSRASEEDKLASPDDSSQHWVAPRRSISEPTVDSLPASTKSMEAESVSTSAMRKTSPPRASHCLPKGVRKRVRRTRTPSSWQRSQAPANASSAPGLPSKAETCPRDPVTEAASAAPERAKESAEAPPPPLPSYGFPRLSTGRTLTSRRRNADGHRRLSVC